MIAMYMFFRFIVGLSVITNLPTVSPIVTTNYSEHVRALYSRILKIECICWCVMTHLSLTWALNIGHMALKFGP